MMPRILLRAFVMVVAMLAAAPVLAADDVAIPLDSDGLPAWSVREWNDFPVRLVLPDREAVGALLDRVPVAAFSREQVAPQYVGDKPVFWVLETRVTDAEMTALEAAGYRPERLRDIERENREASERLWADMYAGKAADVRTDPLNYVPTNDQTGSMLQGIASSYPSIARYFTWGSSIQGRTIHGLVISDNVQVDEAEPQVRYSSSMHGDEITGMVLTIDLAYWLVEHYGQAGYEDVTDLVDNYELYLIPAYNPDGTFLGQRYNANGVDLNRNFDEPAGTHTILEQENVLFINWMNQRDIVLSLNYHGGALVMNYPWDYTYTRAPDDEALQLVSLEYSTRNLPMYNGAFSQGITNGADWYVITGSLQDWCYDQTDCVDVTCEVSNTKWPSGSSLPGYWDDNRDAMIAYARASRWGLTGTITAADTGDPIPGAIITVQGIDKPVHSFAHGDYYKLLHDGTFTVTVEAEGYVTQTQTGVACAWGTENVLDVQMQPLATGSVAGTVTDSQGQPLAATIEVRTWPAGLLVDSASTDPATGDYGFDLFYGDYSLTASSPDHFTETQQVTVGATPAVADFVLGGMVTTWVVEEDFESGLGAFSGDWVTYSPGYNSSQCLVDSESNYPNNASLLGQLSDPVDLTGVMDPIVTFQAKWNIETNWDGCFFEISTNGGGSWTPLAVPGQTQAASGQGGQTPAGVPCFEGTQANWVACTVDLSAYIGYADVRLRFRLATDTSVAYDGFYVDDFKVRVTTEDSGTTAADDLPQLAVDVRAFPNPFNPATTLAFTSPRDGRVTVAVYDLQGRLVRTLVSGAFAAGEHQVRWDGLTDGGRRAGSGVYMARIDAAGDRAAAKLMLVK
jgi:hypothetical protein